MDQVNENATFTFDDKFDRERYAEMCMTLIQNHPADRGACTIAVDAPWGVGKSTFLHMWINDLNAKNDELIAGASETPVGTKQLTLPIYYNAWENDFCDNALAPLLFRICGIVDREPVENKPVPQPGVIQRVVSGSLGLLAAVGVKLATRDDITAQAAGFVAEKTTGALISGLMHRADAALDIPEDGSIGDLYDKQLQVHDEFRNALSELAQEYNGVYIFIDELDRCKPSFAIDTLDVIKHYFNIPGLTFIFGVDMLQLGHAISGRYGFNYDAEGYLSKFFEHHIVLPTPTAEQMIRFCQPSTTLAPDTYMRLNDIFRACMVSPREIPRIAKASKTLLSLIWGHAQTKERDVFRDFIYLMTSMQFRMTSVFNAFIDGQADWNVQHWGEQHSFWELLSFFCPYMTKSASDCIDRWNGIIQNQNNSVIHAGRTKALARIGQAILSNSNYQDYDTFGQCVFRFMEQVYI